MRGVLLFAVITICICSCKEEKQVEIISETPDVAEEPLPRANEVVISLHSTSNSFTTNLFVNELQDKPDLLYLSREEDRTAITIPTEGDINIKGGDPVVSFFYDLPVKKGDSLIVQIDQFKINESDYVNYPVFTIPNSDKNWHELNFQYLLYKRNIENKAIVVSPNPGFPKSSLNTDQIFANSVALLDSLRAIDKISDDFYQKTRLDQKLILATSKIREAKNANQNLDIDALGIELNNEEQLENSQYISYLRTVILYKYFRNERRPSFSKQFDFINDKETVLSGETRLALLNAYLKSIFLVEKGKFQTYLDKFNAINPPQAYKDKWDLIVMDIASNKKKFDLSNRNIGVLTNLLDGNELTFDEILSSQKGKIVLVDFWASWCSPCRLEMPHLKSLQSKFSEDDLQIIEISIDKDFAAWERASKLENLSNEKHNYIISNWQKSNLYKNFDIKTIPRYLLFDSDGSIISEDAPRPSDEKLAELIRTNI